MWINREVVIIVVVCTFAVLALPKDKDDHGRPKQHKDDLSEEEHMVEGEHNPDYDHDAFLGDMKEEFDHLSPEEAKRRLKLLVTKVDTDGDQSVTAEELKKWVKTVFQKKMYSGMEDDVKEKDKDNDGFINWDEFLKDTYGDDVPSEDDNDEEMKKMVERDRKHFDVADANKDGKLSAEEFAGFMHPESNPEMQALNAKETLEDMDKDKDGKLSLDEFLGDYKDPDNPDSEEPEWVKEETDRFQKELDKDGDGKLDEEELKAWIAPDSDATIVDEEVKHLMEESDENKDGKLSIDEIIDHHDVFTGSEATDYGQALPAKEEL